MSIIRSQSSTSASWTGAHAGGKTRVVHEDVWGAARGHEPRRLRPDGLAVSHIHHAGIHAHPALGRDLLGEAGKPFSPARPEHEVRTLASEAAGDGLSDA